MIPFRVLVGCLLGDGADVRADDERDEGGDGDLHARLAHLGISAFAVGSSGVTIATHRP
jgi:hypothetical protein